MTVSEVIKSGTVDIRADELDMSDCKSRDLFSTLSPVSWHDVQPQMKLNLNQNQSIFPLTQALLLMSW